MTKEDYVASGGALKLKGVSNGKIEKKRKKKQIPAESHGIVENTKDQERRRETQIEESDRTIGAEHIVRAEAEAAVSSKLSSDQVGTSRAVQKTEAEIKHDEAKRRRLLERLRKDGGKTHKEKVEDFNRYLSNLSEHHDMPRIGPG